jgi:hypothetical protein
MGAQGEDEVLCLFHKGRPVYEQYLRRWDPMGG